MNLYDKDDGFKQFVLDEANALLPDIIAKTEEALEDLQNIQDRFESEKVIDTELHEDEYEGETAVILQKWSRDMVALGVYPKGYFTVDFKSPVPDTLFCWTYGETEITHTHKVFETFRDRRLIKNKDKPGFEQSLN
ncbi:DUF2203 family protein [candidate division KSB1 bacterium]|nr:DUF2203 family protein [candidate division KSB1 bacterium]NIR71367.1 DUF2203 family protein [candidate division KSB1 bacterium]NIS26257.1 DUF2203 family protein [candidate division KSB1 bacterium]NIT73008.1 DUF2203 family protein [candidate division KSB1 bacterium]NIU26905.1 DUF2203 family protein [candidate division KSB1 bacterium]